MAPHAESKGVPSPELAVTLSAVPLIIGGSSLLLGVKPKLGAAAIIGFLAGRFPKTPECSNGCSGVAS